MSNAQLPTLRGLGWPVKKSPNTVTRVQQSVSLTEVRAAFAPYPQWRWKLPFNFLLADSTADFQMLADFFNARYGRFDSFLYSDPTDNSVTDQRFGTGDGTTVAFQLLRTLTVGGFAEYVYNLNATPVIKDNGVVKTSGVDYNISNGLVTFISAPANTHALTWTGTYFWRVRFDQDAADFQNFLYQLWTLGELTFVSVIGS